MGINTEQANQLRQQIDAYLTLAKAAVDTLLAKDDSYTEGEHGQQMVGYNLDGKPKRNKDGTVDSKTQSQVAYLLSNGSPLSEDQKQKLKDELHSGEIKIVPDKKLLKGRLDRDGDEVRLFVPFTKVVSFKASNGQDAVMVEGCASVADFLDDQGDVPDADALKRAFTDWGDWGNIRLQHKPDHPIGTTNKSATWELPEGIDPPRWWLDTHPETGTLAAFVRCLVLDAEAVKLIKGGVMTGYSIGGSIITSRDVFAEVDDRGVVVAILGDAA